MISLSAQNEHKITMVSNYFIDYYMPTANGAYVKVYLYLLRSLSENRFSVSLSDIADLFEDTENEILRAFIYWEKRGLLTIARDSENNITSIQMKNPEPLSPLRRQEPSFPPSKEVGSPQSETAASVTVTPSQAFSADSEASSTVQITIAKKPTYTSEQIKVLTDHDEIKWLMREVENCLNRLLKSTDIQLILYLYESLGFSAELILFLYQYCVSKNKKSVSYIEAVALSWADNGIDTVEKAEIETSLYHNCYNAVNKAFGLNRAPGSVEKQFINKWLYEYGFHIDIIVEACNRTLLSTQKPTFEYADSILESWYKKKVKSMADIKKLDEAHSRSSGRKAQSQSNSRQNTNKFNAFPQRNYSKEDLTSMEQRLLKRQ